MIKQFNMLQSVHTKVCCDDDDWLVDDVMATSLETFESYDKQL